MEMAPSTLATMFTTTYGPPARGAVRSPYAASAQSVTMHPNANSVRQRRRRASSPHRARKLLSPGRPYPWGHGWSRPSEAAGGLLGGRLLGGRLLGRRLPGRRLLCRGLLRRSLLGRGLL